MHRPGFALQSRGPAARVGCPFQPVLHTRYTARQWPGIRSLQRRGELNAKTICTGVPSRPSHAYGHAAVHHNDSSLFGLSMHAPTLHLDELLHYAERPAKGDLMSKSSSNLFMHKLETFKATHACFCNKACICSLVHGMLVLCAGDPGRDRCHPEYLFLAWSHANGKP